MKKFLSITLSFILVFSLTACGSEKLVATMEKDDEFEAKLEIKFNSDDEPKSINWTIEFEDKDDAKDAYEELEEMIEEYEEEEDKDAGVKAKRSGKKITLKIDPSSDFAENLLGIDDKMSLEDTEKMLEFVGWDVD